MARKKNQLYEVEIKSKAILKEGKKGFITYFQGGNKKSIVKHAMRLYPQYTKIEDKPSFDITPITYREYESRANGDMIQHKGHLIEVEGNII